jgi:hypothetical protein
MKLTLHKLYEFGTIYMFRESITLKLYGYCFDDMDKVYHQNDECIGYCDNQLNKYYKEFYI